jgi:hypothetical protein
VEELSFQKRLPLATVLDHGAPSSFDTSLGREEFLDRRNADFEQTPNMGSTLVARSFQSNQNGITQEA